MQTRLIVVGCLLFTAFLLTPQIAQSVNQDESIKEVVRPAIEAGVEYLKRSQTSEGTWPYLANASSAAPQVIGNTALCAIALMECNVPVNDRQVQAALNVVRRAMSGRFTYNYSICLALLALDRAHRGQSNTHSDSGLIKQMAEAIANGQSNDGGWGYNLPGGASDNSNTQFGVVALWVARKYYKPGSRIDRALQNAEKKFRPTQRQDGGWGYDQVGLTIGNQGSTGSMTCAGVLGLALSAGTKTQPKDASFRGAGASGDTVDVYRNLELDPAVARARNYIMNSFEVNLAGSHSEHLTYFFWSMERVATLYRWKKINDVDWFDVGARFLMKLQNKRTGAWDLDANHGPSVDTSFSLLFLAKSNLLGNLQEADFTGGALGNQSMIPKKKEPEPKKVSDADRAKDLAEQLLTANPKKQAELLDEFIDAKGNDFTYTLAETIDKLSTNSAKESAREALARRIQKMKSSTVSQFLQEDTRELRLAAAVAIGLKNDVSSAGGLIPLLADQDIGISRAALESLKSISGQDFGKSVERWSRWLEKAGEKKP